MQILNPFPRITPSIAANFSSPRVEQKVDTFDDFSKKLIENVILSTPNFYIAIILKTGSFYVQRVSTSIFGEFCFNFKCEITETINLEAEIMI